MLQWCHLKIVNQGKKITLSAGMIARALLVFEFNPFGLFENGLQQYYKILDSGLGQPRQKASVLMQRLSYPIKTFLSNKITRNRIVLSF